MPSSSDAATLARRPVTASASPTIVGRPVLGGVGESVSRPDGIPKVRGAFAFSSDLEAPGMLWGGTLRSPHPLARIEHLDARPALAMRGVGAAIRAVDVPELRPFGLEHQDQPGRLDAAAAGAMPVRAAMAAGALLR